MKNSTQGQQVSAALYMRLSKEDGEQGESESIRNQRSLLLNFVKEHEIKSVREYIDDGYSGMQFDRPAFQQMLRDIEQGKIQLVVTKDLSRLGRDYIQTGYYLEQYFPEHAVRYISLLDRIDSGEESSASDITPFRAVINDMYAKDISRKIKSVKRDKQKKGLFIGGKAPYGYLLSETEKNKLIVDREAAKVVRQIFSLAAKGETCAAIARWLNTNGVLTPLQYAGLRPATTWKQYSGQWQAERIAFLLKNEVYIGNMVQGRVQKASYKSKKILKKPAQEWIVVPGTHEAIVKKELFEQVQHILQKRAKTRVRKYDYLWKGLIYCGICNNVVGVVARQLKKGQTLYLCCRNGQRSGEHCCGHHMIREDLLKEQVAEHIKKMVEECMDWEAVTKQATQEYYKRKTEIREQEKKRIRQMDIFLERLYRDFTNGLLAQEDFERMYQAKKQERTLLQEQMLQDVVGGGKKITPQQCRDLFWKTIATERGFWFSILQRIELISPKDVRVYFRFRN